MNWRPDDIPREIQEAYEAEAERRGYFLERGPKAMNPAAARGGTVMITADEAKSLSGKTADEFLKDLEEAIRIAAEKGSRELSLRMKPYADWAYSLNDEKVLKPEERKVLKVLRDNGFSVTRYYNEGQFVDIALIISWSEEQQP